MGDMNAAFTSLKGSLSAQQIAFIRSQMREQRRPELLGMPLNQLETVVFDLETTGFSHQHGDGILSIGAVRTIGVTVSENKYFHRIVNSGVPVPEHIAALTGITQSMVNDASSLMEGLHDFMAFIEKDVLVAHAAGHDRAFLNAALWKTSKTRLSHRLLDTMMLAQRLFPNCSDYGLDHLLRDNQIPIQGRHHALCDAVMTAKLWTVYVDEIQKQGYAETLGDLYVYLSRT